MLARERSNESVVSRFQDSVAAAGQPVYGSEKEEEDGDSDNSRTMTKMATATEEQRLGY